MIIPSSGQCMCVRVCWSHLSTFFRLFAELSDSNNNKNFSGCIRVACWLSSITNNNYAMSCDTTRSLTLTTQVRDRHLFPGAYARIQRGNHTNNFVEVALRLHKAGHPVSRLQSRIWRCYWVPMICHPTWPSLILAGGPLRSVVSHAAGTQHEPTATRTRRAGSDLPLTTARRTWLWQRRRSGQTLEKR